MTHAVHVQAVAFWSRHYGDVHAWHTRQRCAIPAIPEAKLLPLRARGRSSLLTRMLVEVITQATGGDLASLAKMPLIIGSAYGELDTTAQLLHMMRSGDGALSPARFQHSVHNTAAGQISIAAGCRAFSTCLAAGTATSAAVLMEAMAWLSDQGGEVIVAVADEALPQFFAARQEPFEALAAAILLSAEADSRTLATISVPERDEAASPCVDAGVEDEELARNPSAPLLQVLRAVLAQEYKQVALPGISTAWRFDIGGSRGS